MKPAELKQEYIRLRAEGQSYSYIADQLHISKTTCTRWERDFSSDIDELKRAGLLELYESYGMAKQARIKRIGGTLTKIDEALERADFSKIDPAKLLDFKLKYTEALKGEIVTTSPALDMEQIEAKDIVAAFADLLNRARAGEATAEQTQKESVVLANLLRAYETTEIKAKLDELEAIVGGRQ